jgi:hypothetical protein
LLYCKLSIRIARFYHIVMNHDDSTKSSSRERNIHDEKKEMVRNLFLSGIPEEFISMQLDIPLPEVIRTLKELKVCDEAAI